MMTLNENFFSIIIAGLWFFIFCNGVLDFDIRVNKSLNTNTSWKNMEVSSSCNCQAACISGDGCIAYWTYPHSYRWRCFLFLYGPTHYLINGTKPGGICAVRIYKGSTLEVDGLYYFIPTKPSLNFTFAREDCKVALGYRLAVPKTSLSFNAVKYKYYTQYPFTVFDLLQNLNDRSATFGDGTPFQDSEVAKFETLQYNNFQTRAAFGPFAGHFDDHDEATPNNPLCQGNPLSIGN